ncbi:hypothetical protein [Paenibacillus sp. MMS18-CY102]|uniref:hypothetical protein n=1 Tax=Paenibacillus sp. MMS18-CY102 TaxID=2682849 RepID=UPI0013655BC3|nr:hypothetical protein [Paenibacillus sp. MMS18-CY102]MWC29340.1 hypothetical protein [Paenibacillus sp. MMS18-CY102]
MSIRRKLYFAGLTLLLILLIMPSPTPEWAVRKKLFFHDPINAMRAKVTEGTIKDDPMYGDLYYATRTELSFVYVKHGAWGYYAAGAGTAP